MENNLYHYLTLKEVALYLRVTEKTVHRLLDRNAIPATKLGKLWRFRKDDIDEWLQGNSKTEVDPRNRTGS